MIPLRTQPYGLGLVPVQGLGAWWNPIDWISEGAKYVWHGADAAGGWAWDGAKWVYGKVLDRCTYVTGYVTALPESVLKKVKDIIRAAGGCSPVAQASATAAVAAALTPIVGPTSPLLATIGVAEIIYCLCQKGIDNVNVPSGPPPTKTPVPVAAAVIGIGAVAAAALILLRRR